MRAPRIIARGLLTLTLASGSAAAQVAGAGQTVHRCAGPTGEIVFSGLPCGAPESPGTATGASDTASSAPLSVNACPVSRDELRDRVAALVARHDTNALAGLMHWRGVDARTANSRLLILRDLLKRPLIAIEAPSDLDETFDNPAALDNGTLRLRTGSDDAGGPREHVFGVAADPRCYWLTW